MVRAGLIEIEEAEFEKEGEVIRFRKVRLTEAGLEVRPMTPLALADQRRDGGGVWRARVRRRREQGRRRPRREERPEKTWTGHPVQLSAEDEALAARLREWRAAEAKRLRVPAYVVLHDRTLTALAQARPANPRQLLEIDGMGPAKVEKFGAAILGLCGNG